MAILFGVDETIRCIDDVGLVGPADEQLCLAHKTAARIFGGGVYLRDEGYVLGVLEEADDPEPSEYFEISADDITEYQTEGLLPTPLPDYSIPVTDYLWGYSLWIVLAVGIVWALYSTRHLKEQGGDADDPRPLAD